VLTAIAQAHPRWAVVLIGPRVGSFDELERQPNVYFLGQRDYHSLPSYAKAFDVCIIPFVSDKLTAHTNPTKVLEYFAAGKPVVSTFIPDIQEYYRDIAYIASDRDGFLQAVELAVSEGRHDAERLRRGVKVAQRATWESVVGQMMDDLASVNRTFS
jgi:glycosyltransferase involved in cell wall biosynthesis